MVHDISKFRIAHIHIPKTAGTAFRSAFTRHFKNNSRIFPHYQESKYIGIDRNAYDFYSGHIGFDTAFNLDADLVTVLRDPLDRFISVYHFWRQIFESKVEQSVNTTLASKFEFEEFIELVDSPD